MSSAFAIDAHLEDCKRRVCVAGWDWQARVSGWVAAVRREDAGGVDS